MTLSIDFAVDWLLLCYYNARSASVRRANSLKIIHMSTHGDKEVEEESATLLHLRLHCLALLEMVAVADDDGKVMTSQARFRGGCMVVSPSS